MRTVARLFSVAVLAVVAGANPAFAWWRFAQWGLSEEQIVSASRGQAVPCRPTVPVCSSALAGAAPRLVIEEVNMVGLHGATAFVFDAGGALVQTIVLFPAVDFAQAAAMVQGAHGPAAEDRAGAAATRVWRDERRHSIITVTAAGSGTLLTYRPMN
jgi:hypothetical protein